METLVDFNNSLFLTLIFCVFLTSSGNPKTLMSQCRLAVRRHLKKMDKIQHMEELEMPRPLINFLQYKSVPAAPL